MQFCSFMFRWGWRSTKLSWLLLLFSFAMLLVRFLPKIMARWLFLTVTGQSVLQKVLVHHPLLQLHRLLVLQMDWPHNGAVLIPFLLSWGCGFVFASFDREKNTLAKFHRYTVGRKNRFLNCWKLDIFFSCQRLNMENNFCFSFQHFYSNLFKLPIFFANFLVHINTWKSTIHPRRKFTDFRSVLDLSERNLPSLNTYCDGSRTLSYDLHVHV